MSELCEKCGHVMRISDFPFCPHEPTKMSVIGDDVPGGFVVENGFDEPTRFYSKSEHRKALDARGLEMRVRWAGPNDKHVTRWDGADAYTLAAAASLVDRSRVLPSPSMPIEKATLPERFRVEVDG